MPNDSEGLIKRSSRFHIVTNPPPHGRTIVQSLERLWPKKVGKRGISKNEVRGIIQQARNVKLGGTDEVVRCLSNAGVLISSADDGAAVYYIDSVRAKYIVDLLDQGTRTGYADPTQDHIDQRRTELRAELIASRAKESSTDTDSSDAETFHRGCDDLARDLHRLEVDMRLFFERGRVPSGS